MILTKRKVTVINNNGKKYKRSFINLPVSVSKKLGFVPNQEVTLLILREDEVLDKERIYSEIERYTASMKKKEELDIIRREVEDELAKIQDSVYVDESDVPIP